jgi:hypothetical protein
LQLYGNDYAAGCRCAAGRDKGAKPPGLEIDKKFPVHGLDIMVIDLRCL